MTFDDKKIDEISPYTKWYILGIILGVAAGLSALAFYFSL